MNLQQRVHVLVQLGNYMLSDDQEWNNLKEKAFRHNQWFLPHFIDIGVHNISKRFLQKPILESVILNYGIPKENISPKKIGIVMAGNIPLVGFHDLLCTFLTGHIATIKLSSKDDILLKHLVVKMIEFSAEAERLIIFQEMLKDCDAYIATGSNNTSRYFEYYFKKYPHIIRKNKTSVAVLTGKESAEDLDKLTDDIHLFFGLGCRNVTKIYVPHNFDFVPLLDAFNKYGYLINNSKYMNNYDYQLSLLILNKKRYMTNGSLLLVEETPVFSPIAQLHYEYYNDENKLIEDLQKNENIQCIVGKNHINFGEAQCPAFNNFADGVDTVKFLLELNNRV